jgi:hypothetical protein
VRVRGAALRRAAAPVRERDTGVRLRHVRVRGGRRVVSGPRLVGFFLHILGLQVNGPHLGAFLH